MLYETPSYIPIEDSAERDGDAQLGERLALGETALTELESKELFAAYGIATTLPVLATSANEAVDIAHRLNFPVVMKIASPQILHKTEVQGVVLNVVGDQDVQTAFAGLTKPPPFTARCAG